MKLLNKYFILLFTVGIVFSSCEDVEDNVIDAGQPGVVTTLTGSTGSILATTDADLNILSIDQTVLSLTADVVEAGTSISKVVLKKSFNSGEEVVVQEFNSFPITYTVNSLSGFNEGVNPSGDIAIGDTYTYRVYVVTASGREITYVSSSVSVTINCNSDLAGTYTTLTSGATGGGSPSPYADIPYEVTFTEVDAGVYEVSDLTFGLYPVGYGSADNPGNLTDVCGTLSINAQPDVVYGGDEFDGTGVVNTDGTFTIEWSNGYGDSGTTVLTKKP